MTTALVLGGGGITGIAWEVGVLAGLRKAGVDLTNADLIVGTSAGSVVGTLIATGIDLDALTEAQQRVDPQEPAIEVDLAALARVFGVLLDPDLDPVRARARVGELALAAPVGDEQARVNVIAHRLPRHDWPARRLLITSVDVATGEAAVWDRGSGVPLVRAVAASCAIPCVFPPVTINGRRYMDGGVRSGINADLAAGATAAVVLAPLARLSALAAPAEELELLRRTGPAVLVAPDDATAAAFGSNVLDIARRPAAVLAGLAQGAAEADRIGAIWPG